MKAENGISRVLLGRIRYGKARSPSHGFRKVPERDFQKSTSRKLDEGVRHLGRINLRLGRIESGITGLDSGIKTMDRHMGGHFRRLDRKYDRFGATMAKVARDLHGIRGDLRKAVSGGKTAR